MMTLFYSPGACSLASHIVLEETEAAYETHPVILAKGEQNAESYRKINPRGKVPALRLDDGTVLTENVAILTYLARLKPEAGLMPGDPLAEARCLSMMAWFSNTVHPAFAHIARPARFAEDESAHETLKTTARRTFEGCLQEIDAAVAGRTWMQGDRFTVCDPYALVFYTWGVRIGLPVGDLAGYTAWKERMLTRPAVRRVLEREQNPLLQTV
jgi:glutathione S-transferase